MMTLACILLATAQQAEMGIVSVDLVDQTFKPTRQRPEDASLRFAVNFRVIGGRTHPFSIKATLGDDVIVQKLDAHSPGDHSRIYTFSKPMEERAKLIIEIDSGKTAGIANRDYCTYTADVEILHNKSAPSIAYRDSKTYTLLEKMSISGGLVGSKVVVSMTTPMTSSVCEVIERDPRVTTKDEFDEIGGVFDSNGQFEFERTTRIVCRAVQVNPLKLRQVTWKQLDSDDSQTQFLKDGSKLEVNDPTTKQFVEEALGANYRETHSPFDAALQVFRAIKSKIRYEITDIYQPSRTLAMGRGQCASGNRLMCAALRHMGIPARTMGGFYGPVSDGGHNGHRIVEFYLPSVGWVPCDATPLAEPRASSAGFGNVDASNLYVTWDDDSRYECGYGFPGRVSGNGTLRTSVRMELQKR